LSQTIIILDGSNYAMVVEIPCISIVSSVKFHNGCHLHICKNLLQPQATNLSVKLNYDVDK
jgi:hypothetical protein